MSKETLYANIDDLRMLDEDRINLIDVTEKEMGINEVSVNPPNLFVGSSQ